MKKIQIYKLEDEIPSNALFIHIEHTHIRNTTKVITKLYYEVPVLEEKQARKEDKHRENIEQIIEHLNQKTGGKYTSKSKTTVSLIRTRLNEGRTLEDFKQVIDTKTAEWLDDPDWSRYLRPQTLFGNKFDGYLSTKTGGQMMDDNFNELDELMKGIK